MPEPSEKIGLQAFLDTTVFQQAMKIYSSGIEQMNKLTDRAAKTMTGVLYSAMRLIGTGAALISDATAGAGKSMEQMNFKSMALAVTLGQILANAIQTVVGRLKEFITGGIMAASRVQELSYVLQILGGRAGYSAEQLDTLVKSVVDFGIQTDEAQNTIIQFIKNNLDLAKATDLARVAQDAAVIGQINSSDALNRIIHGITTYNTEVLRTMQVNMQNAFKDFAQTLGKSTEALTVDERAQAALNAVLEEGAKIAGAYEAAMETPGKQLRSFTRDLFELTRVMGEPFLTAFGNVVGIMRDLAKIFKTAFDEGGAFRDAMIKLGGAAAFFTEKIRTVVTGFAKLITGITTGGLAIERFINFINTIAPGFGALTISILGVVGAFLAIKLIAGVILGAFTLISTVIGGLAAAFTFLLTPIGLVSAALLGLVAIVVGVLLSTASTARQTFSDIATEAATWGANIVNALAEGMISAIASVINAIAQIGAAIAYWLAPGSPPRILPEIYQWGIDTMAQYYDGMAEAYLSNSPFSIIQNKMEDGFRKAHSIVISSLDDLVRIIRSGGIKIGDYFKRR